MNTHKNQAGFGVLEISALVLVIAIIATLGWVFYNKYADKESEQQSVTKESESSKTVGKANDKPNNKTESLNLEDVDIDSITGERVAIYPSINDDGMGKGVYQKSFETTLPSGWKVEALFEPYNLTKSFGQDKYLISSWVGSSNKMKQRVDEGVSLVKAFKTKKGTTVAVLKTPTVLFLANCIPKDNDCYLKFDGNQNLYIHLYQLILGAQNDSTIDYSSESAKQATDDFIKIAATLNI